MERTTALQIPVMLEARGEVPADTVRGILVSAGAVPSAAAAAIETLIRTRRASIDIPDATRSLARALRSAGVSARAGDPTICEPCARANGATYDEVHMAGATGSRDVCGYCGTVAEICATSDWTWPADRLVRDRE